MVFMITEYCIFDGLNQTRFMVEGERGRLRLSDIFYGNTGGSCDQNINKNH